MFMEPEIYQGVYYEVINRHGESSFLPGDLVGRHPQLEDFADYIEGEPDRFEKLTGVLGRLTAPGYLDATEWEPFDSVAEAETSLAEDDTDDVDDLDSEGEDEEEEE